MAILLEHSLITDPDIHEPKGIDAATAGQVYISDGAGSGSWTDIESSSAKSLYVPSDKTGATDMASEFETFLTASLTAADTKNKPIIVQGGSTIKLRNFGNGLNFSTLIAAGVTLIDIDFNHCSLLHDNDANLIIFDQTGQASSEATVTSVSNVQRNTESVVGQIVMSSSLSGQAHDWVCVYSEDANPSKSGGKMGEMHQLIEDESSNTLYTSTSICRPSLFTTTIRARLLNKQIRLVFRNLIVKANGDVDDVGITTREEAIFILGFVEPRVINAVYDRPWTVCCRFQVCANPVQTGYEVKNTLNQGNSNGFSYGTQFYGMNSFGVAQHAIIKNGRHPGATTDGNNGGTTTWYNKGYPTDYVIQNISGVNCYGSIADSHEEGWRGTIQYITAHGAKQDGVTPFIGRAVQSRAGFETIQHIVAIDCAQGISISAVDHGQEDLVVVKDITCRSISDTVHTAVGVDVRDQNTLTNKRRTEMSVLKFEGVDKAVVLGIDSLNTINGIDVSGAEFAFDVRANSTTRVKGLLSDHTKATYYNRGTTHVQRVRSAVAGTTRIEYLDTPVVIMGTTNQPQTFFEEADTLGTRVVFHPGVRLCNPNGVTAMLSKEAGSTFTDSTAISLVTL